MKYFDVLESERQYSMAGPSRIGLSAIKTLFEYYGIYSVEKREYYRRMFFAMDSEFFAVLAEEASRKKKPQKAA